MCVLEAANYSVQSPGPKDTANAEIASDSKPNPTRLEMVLDTTSFQWYWMREMPATLSVQRKGHRVI